MLSFRGDHDEEIINFPNGFCVKIDFGDEERNEFGGFLRCKDNEHRRIRVFDKDKKLISEIIEENPYYDPRDGPLPSEFFEGRNPDVIF